MKLKMKLSIILLLAVSFIYAQNASMSPEKSDQIKYRHSLGASFFMLGNFLDDSPDYYLLTYGYRLTQKDRLFTEFNTWKYAEPLGSYRKSEKLYPGYVRAFGVGFGYQRFHWKGLFTTIQATPFIQQYYDENNKKIQKGFQLYLQ